VSTLKTDALHRDNVRLRQDVLELRRQNGILTTNLKERDKELGKTNKVKELVNLCKLCLTGSLIPVASMFGFYLLIGSSVPFE
jgi:nitrogenase molybdenum-iron protein alpha/beta subunit